MVWVAVASKMLWWCMHFNGESKARWMYNACDLNRWTACRWAPLLLWTLAQKNTIFFFCIYFLPYRFAKGRSKRSKNKGKKVEVAIHGFKEKDRFALRSRNWNTGAEKEIYLTQARTPRPSTYRCIAANIKNDLFSFQTWSLRILFLKKKTRIVGSSKGGVSRFDELVVEWTMEESKRNKTHIC